MRIILVTLLLAPMLVVLPAKAGAQPPPPVTETTIAERHDVINDKQHHYIGKVEMDNGRDTKLYADDVWVYVDENRAVATGNVVFREGNSQISADRGDFNIKTRLGTFYNASGFTTVQPPRQTAMPGVVAPPRTGQDTIVYFFGETVEKIGSRKYRIVAGGFTTCVQPTPRWDLHADTIILNLDHYTFLKQVVMNVKGVPLFYLPVLYYPTKREGRATGFLLPTYGTSTVQGQSLHNAFFWAINRSQDATIMHDWFSKTGQGVGSEYRYDFGGGSDGAFRGYLRNVTSDGTVGALPAERSYTITGSANQLLPGRLRAVGRVNYFSSIATNQTLNTNIADASRSQRDFGGNITGAVGPYSVNATINRTEYFYSQTSSTVSGSWPRLNVSRNERPVQNTPFYFSATGEYANILSDRRNGADAVDLGLARIHFAPQVRFPFKNWQWFTVNTTASWLDTYYSRSYDPATIDPVNRTGTVIHDNLNRQYFTVQSQITGPVFNRIWDTPGNGYAEKFKHTIEPHLTVMRTSLIDNYLQIIKLEGIDQIVGGATQYSYGVTNRFYAKRRSAAPGQSAQAREILNVELQQAYYSDEEAAKVDPQFSTSNSGGGASHFSPVLLSVRATPTTEFTATARAEFDSRYRALRRIDASGSYSFGSQLQTMVSWSKRGFIPQLVGFNDPSATDQSINTSSTVRTRDNKYRALHSLTYDVLHGTMTQQRITGFYNAQCCGLAFEFQKYRFGSGVSSITGDHRFFMSFTLAGLGNFTPFNGALGGVPR